MCLIVGDATKTLEYMAALQSVLGSWAQPWTTAAQGAYVYKYVELFIKFI